LDVLKSNVVAKIIFAYVGCYPIVKFSSRWRVETNMYDGYTL